MSLVSLSEVKVGALVLLSVALLLVLTLSIGNFRDFFANNLTIYITVPSVNGLDNFSPVTYSGVRIGTVTKKWFDETLDKAVIEARIDYDSPVSIDSKVQFTSAGLLAPLYVDISAGSKEKRLRTLIQKGEIDRNKIYLDATPYVSFGEIFAVASDLKGVLKQVETILNGVGELPADLAGFVRNASQDITEILNEMNGLLTEGRPLAVSALDRMNGLVLSVSNETTPALRDIRKGAADIPSLVTDTHQKMTRVMDKANGMIETASPAIVQLSNEAIALIQNMQNQVQTLQSTASKMLNDADGLITGNREEIGRIMAHLERTASNLNEISNEIKKNPWRIFWKTNEKLPPGRVSPQWNPIPKGE